MSFTDKIKDTAQQVAGQVKDKVGQLTGDRDLREEGQREQTAGEVKEAGHAARDKAEGAMDAVRDRAQQAGDTVRDAADSVKNKAKGLVDGIKDVAKGK
ncbi:CsbD family protein [Pseudonocardiaceae bacterium YIM PH 21723]|nr:CsbD family protein [Pseudonocardiaceae bacterium YIM PH 21723]